MVIAPEQAGKLKVIKGHFEDLESQKAEFEEFIAALAVPYQQKLAILQTAPDISSVFTAIDIISGIDTDMKALYHMLKNWENYNAVFYRKSDLPDREITVEQEIIIAKKGL